MQTSPEQGRVAEAVEAATENQAGEVSPGAGDDAAVSAWRSMLELVGWGKDLKPRFPVVALELDLSPKQLGVLVRLEPGAERPMGAIAEQLYCDASYVTDLVDRLEERGLIERRPDPGDRRVKLLALTADGERMRERALEKLYEPPAGLLELSADERQTLSELLAKALATVPAAEQFSS